MTVGVGQSLMPPIRRDARVISQTGEQANNWCLFEFALSHSPSSCAALVQNTSDFVLLVFQDDGGASFRTALHPSERRLATVVGLHEKRSSLCVRASKSPFRGRFSNYPSTNSSL